MQAEVQKEQINLESTSIWRNNNYLFLWSGHTISQFGDKLYLLALPWLVLELTGSVISATLTLALEVIAEILFAPFVGVLIDRVSRKKLMILTDILRGSLMLTIPFLYFFGALPVEFIYFTAVALSILTLMFESASQAYLPSILNKEQLMDGNAKMTMVATIMRVAGPVAAGLFIATFGADITIGINGLTFFLSVLFLLFIKDTKTHITVADEPERDIIKTKMGTLKKDVKEGFSYLIKHPILWPITLFSMMMNFSIYGVSGLFVFESKIGQGASADMTAMIFWISGIFAFIATLIVKPLNKLVTKGQMIRFGSIGVGIALGSVALYPSMETMILCFTLLLMIGIFVNVSMMTLRQEIVPSHLLGRVMTTTRVLSQSISPIAIILSGIIAHQFSVQLVFMLATILVGINVCFAWFGRMKRIE